MRTALRWWVQEKRQSTLTQQAVPCLASVWMDSTWKMSKDHFSSTNGHTGDRKGYSQNLESYVWDIGETRLLKPYKVFEKPLYFQLGRSKFRETGGCTLHGLNATWATCYAGSANTHTHPNVLCCTIQAPPTMHFDIWVHPCHSTPPHPRWNLEGRSLETVGAATARAVGGSWKGG